MNKRELHFVKVLDRNIVYPKGRVWLYLRVTMRFVDSWTVGKIRYIRWFKMANSLAFVVVIREEWELLWYFWNRFDEVVNFVKQFGNFLDFIDDNNWCSCIFSNAFPPILAETNWNFVRGNRSSLQANWCIKHLEINFEGVLIYRSVVGQGIECYAFSLFLQYLRNVDTLCTTPA